EDGHLRDYLIVPEYFKDYLGVNRWEESSGTLSGRSTPTTGAYSVADPRFESNGNDYGQYGLCGCDQSMGAIINVKSPGQGMYAVQDPRVEGERHKNVYRIVRFDQTAGTVTSDFRPASGGGVADPRMNWNPGAHAAKLRVTEWEGTHVAVTGARAPYSGACAVSDPRPGWNRQSGNLVVTEWENHS